jgi:hypothetical protein
VAIKVQFKALAQHRLVDLTDPALPGGAGVRHDNIDSAEGGSDARERALY